MRRCLDFPSGVQQLLNKIVVFSVLQILYPVYVLHTELLPEQEIDNGNSTQPYVILEFAAIVPFTHIRPG